MYARILILCHKQHKQQSYMGWTNPNSSLKLPSSAPWFKKSLSQYFIQKTSMETFYHSITLRFKTSHWCAQLTLLSLIIIILNWVTNMSLVSSCRTDLTLWEIFGLFCVKQLHFISHWHVNFVWLLSSVKLSFGANYFLQTCAFAVVVMVLFK